MFKTLLLAAATLVALDGVAFAQNPQCPTRPVGDNTNACASTAFVQQALSTGLPLAHTHIYVGNASNLATDFGSLVTFTDQGAMTLAPTSGTALTINPVANTNNLGVAITQSSPSTPARVQATAFGYNTINLNDQVGVTASGTTFGFPNNHSIALFVTDVIGGSNLTGTAHKAIQGIMRETIANSTAGDSVAVGGQAYSNVSGPAGVPIGGILSGGAFQSYCDTGCNRTYIEGIEIDVGINGTAANRAGLAIWQIGSAQAAGIDTAIVVTGNSSVGTGGEFKSMVTLSNIGGTKPLTTTADLFVADTAYTIANVFNLSNLTVTGNILSFPNVVMTGAGVVGLGTNTPPVSSILQATCSSCGSALLNASPNGVAGTSGFKAQTSLNTNAIVMFADEPAATFTVFGQTMANWVHLTVSGAANSGLAFGTVVNTPLWIGTNNVAREVILGNGNIGFGTETNPQFPAVFSTNAVTGMNSGNALGISAFGGPWAVGAAGAAATGWNTLAVAGPALNNFVRIDTTISSPSNIQSSDLIGSITFGGWGAGTLQASRARIFATATETWTTTFGVSIEIDTVAVGGTRAQAMLIKGGVIVGSGTTDPGVNNLIAGGTIEATGVFRNNGNAGVTTTCTETVGNTLVFTGGILTTKGANCT